MDDFRRVIEIAHRLEMSVIIFENVGYSAVDAPTFLKASDVREGRTSRESQCIALSSAISHGVHRLDDPAGKFLGQRS